MRSLFICMLVLLCIVESHAQNTFNAQVKNEQGEPLQGTTVEIKVLNKTFFADSNGTTVIKNIPQGKFELLFSHIGYREYKAFFDFPLYSDTVITIYLVPIEKEENEVVVTATRSSRTISNIPTRVETISGEEIEEKGNMKPGDIRMMLNESTGIQTQQTSAISANSSIRIQGLDGKYTQVIRDGFPLYSGFSGGLGLLQTPP
ncbi:MAG: carboxypeptidase-like regulatory domain-containing protein, partial [Bacteroidetes bacterium]|nr:carboxypeptidase-like regulatory domain-containing protein [Bacteroidota bacterium]